MNLRPVIIEMQNGKPVVVSCPKKVQVIIREPKRKSLRKRWRTAVYNAKAFLKGVQ